MRAFQHGLWLLSLCSTAVLASPGVVDRYGCHKHPQTGEYHCHGSLDQAKQSHLLFGAISASSVWLYDNGPYNAFTGAGVQFELGNRHYAGYGSYSYQFHLTGSSDYSTSGWDIGLKLGPNIARLGLHPFLSGGYFNHNFKLPSGFTLPYGGFQYGVGFIWNQPSTAWDFRVLNRTTASLEDNWRTLGAPGLTHDVSIQLGVYLRH